MLLAEVWVFILGNVIAGTAKRLPQLVAGRLISGVGGAGILALSTIIVSRQFIDHPHTDRFDRLFPRADSRTSERIIHEPDQLCLHYC